MKALLAGIVCFSTLAVAADLHFGKDPAPGEPLTIATLAAKAADYEGKTVQVKGRVTEVCEAMGCWMDLADDRGNRLHMDVGDNGEIHFPKDAVGKVAVIEGKFSTVHMTREQVIAEEKEMAADAGRKFNPKKIKSGRTVLRVDGTGAVISQ